MMKYMLVVLCHIDKLLDQTLAVHPRRRCRRIVTNEACEVSALANQHVHLSGKLLKLDMPLQRAPEIEYVSLIPTRMALVLSHQSFQGLLVLPGPDE